MKVRTPILAAWLSFIGSLIMLINVLAVAASGSSIVISSNSASRINDILSAKSAGWYRVAFGIKPLVEGPTIIIWLFIAVLNLSLAALMVLTPERPKENYSILLLSTILLLTGGGFIIGFVLAAIGCIMSFQWRKTAGETFIGKLLRALRLDPKLFQLVKKDKELNEAAFVILFVSFLSGLGSGLYLYNADKILHSSTDALRILLYGEVLFDVSVFGLPLMNIGLAMIKWLLLSLIIYLIGSRIVGIKEVDFSDVARTVSYAYTPISLQMFLPILFSTEPILSTIWPLTVTFITNLWMIFALIIAIKVCFEITFTKATGMIMLSGPIYWILVNKFMLPTIFRSSMPGIFMDINPVELVIILTSISFIISYLFGTFKKY